MISPAVDSSSDVPVERKTSTCGLRMQYSSGGETDVSSRRRACSDISGAPTNLLSCRNQEDSKRSEPGAQWGRAEKTTRRAEFADQPAVSGAQVERNGTGRSSGLTLMMVETWKRWKTIIYKFLFTVLHSITKYACTFELRAGVHGNCAGSDSFCRNIMRK